MPSSSPTLSRAARALALVTAFGLSACGTDAPDPTSPTIDAVRVFAPGGNKGGGGNDTGGGSIVVGATSPSELPRGVVSVDLIVTGSGFESGSEVGFEIDGAATDRIVTNGVTYVDESTLVANVDVEADALMTLYDVAVRNGPKKKGVGVDILKIVAPEHYPVVEGTRMFDQDDAGYLILYDAENGRVVGKHDSCGWIYDVETGTRGECLTMPGYDLKHPNGINASGRIVGVGYPEGETSSSIGFVIDPPYASAVMLTVDGWDRVRPFAVNSAGEIAASVDRTRLVTHKNGRVMGEDQEFALVRFAPDLSVAAVSTPIDGVLPGIGSMSDNGLVESAAGRLWNGQHGTPLVAPDPGAFGDVSLQGITSDGMLLGGAQQRGNDVVPVAWPDPWGSPARLSNFALGTARGVDDAGNILVWGDGDAFCIGPSGVSRLGPLPGYDVAQLRAGTGGLIFGLSSSPDADQPTRAFTVWDVSDGC